MRVWKDCPTHSAMNGLLVWQDEYMISHVCGQTDDHWGEDWKGPIDPCPTCVAHYAGCKEYHSLMLGAYELDNMIPLRAELRAAYDTIDKMHAQYDACHNPGNEPTEEEIRKLENQWPDIDRVVSYLLRCERGLEEKIKE